MVLVSAQMNCPYSHSNQFQVQVSFKLPSFVQMCLMWSDHLQFYVTCHLEIDSCPLHLFQNFTVSSAHASRLTVPVLNRRWQIRGMDGEEGGSAESGRSHDKMWPRRLIESEKHPQNSKSSTTINLCWQKHIESSQLALHTKFLSATNSEHIFNILLSA